MGWIVAGMVLCFLDARLIPLALVFYLIGLLED